MAVAHDASSTAHASGSSSVSQASFSWTHTPVGTPRGVLVFVFTNANSDFITSVTYGGTAMTRIAGGQAIDTTTEPCRTDTFFLGASIATGAQSIVVNRTNNVTVMTAMAATVTGATDTIAHLPGIVLIQNDGTLAEQSVSDGSLTTTNSVRYAAAFSGLAAPPGVGASSTTLQSNDLGNNGCRLVRETTAGTGSRSVGFSAATDDRAVVHLAIRENNIPVTADKGTLTLTGRSAATVLGYTETAARGTLSISGKDSNLSRQYAVTAARGTLSLTGNSALLSDGAVDYPITAERRQFTVQGFTAVTRKAIPLGALLDVDTTGSVNLSELSFDGSQWRIGTFSQLIASRGTFSLTGRAAAVNRGNAVDAARGSFTLSGKDAALAYAPASNNYPITAGVGSFALTGQSISSTRTYSLTALAGTFSLTGRPATVARGDAIDALRGSFALTGRASTLTFTPGPVNYSLAADRGSFTLTGRDAALGTGIGILCNRGSFILTGRPVALNIAVNLTASRGAFTLTGQPVLLVSGEQVTAARGILTLTGQPITVTRTYSITAARGAFTLSGRPAALEYVSGQQPFNPRPPEYVGGSAVIFSQVAFSLPLAGSGWQAGDLCLVVIETANQAITVSGFTNVPASPQGQGTAGAAGGVRLTVQYRWLVEGDREFVIPDSGDHQIAYLAVFRYVSPTEPFNATAGGTLAATRDVVCPQVTTTKNNCLLVNILSTDRDADSSNNFATRANNQWTNNLLSSVDERADRGTRLGNGGGIALATGVQVASGPSGNTTVGQSQSAALAAITLALSPSGNAYNLTAGRGTFLLTGRPKIGRPFYNLRPQAGSFEITGNPIRSQPFYNLLAERGDFQQYGKPVDLDLSRGPIQYGTVASAGTFTINGQPIGEQYSTGLGADRGAFVFVGFDNETVGPIAYAIEALGAQFIWQGRPATIFKSFNLLARRRQFPITGFQMDPNRQRFLSAARGSLVLRGRPTFGIKSGKRKKFGVIT